MKYRQLAAETLFKHLTDYLDERYQEDIARGQWNKLSKSKAFDGFQKSALSKKFNQFVADTMLDIGMKVYAENRDSVHAKIKKEVTFIIENLFDETEAEQIYNFCTTDVGRKLLRNLDIFREAYTEAAMELVLKSYEAYCKPEVSEMIMAYMAQLEEEMEQDDGSDV